MLVGYVVREEGCKDVYGMGWGCVEIGRGAEKESEL